MSEPNSTPALDPVSYADPQAFENFKNCGHLGGVYGREWMWARPDNGLVPLYSDSQVKEILAKKDECIQTAREDMANQENKANLIQMDLVMARNRIKDLESALRIAEAALADISDAEREPCGELSWRKKRASQALLKVRETIANKRPGYVSEQQAADRRGYESAQHDPDSVSEAMILAAAGQIGEGLGAYLRKFANSEAALKAREGLHEMPREELAGMTKMIAQEAVAAAWAKRESPDDGV